MYPLLLGLTTSECDFLEVLFTNNYCFAPIPFRVEKQKKKKPEMENEPPVVVKKGRAVEFGPLNLPSSYEEYVHFRKVRTNQNS